MGGGHTLPKMEQEPPECNPYSLYLSCDHLPLDKFIRCICDSDLQALVISGNVPLHILADAWADIFYEYLDMQQHNHSRYKIELIRDITKLQARLFRVETILYCLRIMYHPDIHAQLAALEIEVKLNPHDSAEYLETLNAIHSRSREWAIDIKLKQAELESLDEHGKDSGTIGKTYFTSVLAKIATYKRVPVIRTTEIMVTEFCAMYEEWIDYLQSQSQSLKKTYPNG